MWHMDTIIQEKDRQTVRYKWESMPATKVLLAELPHSDKQIFVISWQIISGMIYIIKLVITCCQWRHWQFWLVDVHTCLANVNIGYRRDKLIYMSPHCDKHGIQVISFLTRWGQKNADGNFESTSLNGNIYFVYDFWEICLKRFHWQWPSIGSGNGLATNGLCWFVDTYVSPVALFTNMD